MPRATWGAPSDESPNGESRSERRKMLARTLAQGGVTGVHVISYESAQEVLTEKRRELVETLADEEVESLQGLADFVGRDKSQVSRDLGLLAEHGIIGFEKDGNKKRPYLQHDHIVVEPIL